MGERTVIYYYSGSGNSLSVAKQVAAKLGHTDLVSIYKLQDDAKVPEKYGRVGICTPSCFIEPPAIVTKLCEKLEISPSQKVFIIATGGADDGFVRVDLKKILTPKTDYPVQTFFVRMPPNHIVGYDPYPDDFVKECLEQSIETIARVAEDIEKDAPPEEIPEKDREKVLKSCRDYNKSVGVDLDSLKCEFHSSEDCKKCGTCVKICKSGNIELTKDGPVWGQNCEQCMACIQWCPQNAVRHPNVPVGRKQYRNPDITLSDMLQSEFCAEED